MRKRMRTRDAVVGDIILNDWEEHCVREPVFQRLHRIKQLGNAFHVYPAAMHTRFEHSLGVCYQVERLISHPNFFLDGYKPSKTERKLTRLAGLLHDIVHIPYKHTLDSDAKVIPDIGSEEEYSRRLSELEIGKILSNEERKILLSILATKDAYDLEKPYMRQVVEDTLSADLLDYTLRDAYFTTGWRKRWDERVYDHIAVSLYNGKPCLVANITDEEGKETPSAWTELANLLYIRFMLHERVYFYPTKIAADSLLVKAVRHLLASKNMDVFLKTIRNYSDEELINHLIEKGPSDTRIYARLLKDRTLPKLILSFDKTESTLTDNQMEKIKKHCHGFPNLAKWLKCEENIAKEAHTDPKNIIIYCHSTEMRKKLSDLLVRIGPGEPSPLRNNTKKYNEIKNVAEKHEDLWRCYVFSIERDEKVCREIERAANAVLRSLK